MWSCLRLGFIAVICASGFPLQSLAQQENAGFVIADLKTSENDKQSARQKTRKLQPKPVVRVPPVFPERAVGRIKEGKVTIELTIAPDGSVKDPRVVETTHRVFNRPALRAISRWKYPPRARPLTGVRETLVFTQERDKQRLGSKKPEPNPTPEPDHPPQPTPPQDPTPDPQPTPVPEPEATPEPVPQPTPEEPVSAPGPLQELTADEQNELLEAHNAYRAQHCAPALTWSDEAATLAQEWADHMAQTEQFAHRPSETRMGMGENLYFFMSYGSTGVRTARDAVDAWYAEVEDYTYSGPTPHYVTGHFTQVVWASTERVGCGRASVTGDQTKTYMVCNYDPPGNYNNQYQANVKPPLCD